MIIDFGSQVTQLIARRVREEGVYSEICHSRMPKPPFTPEAESGNPSGGPELVHGEGSPRAPQAIFDFGLPMLAICYGQQTTAMQLGGIVEGGHRREFGRADIQVKAPSHLFDSAWDVGEKHPVWMSHGDRMTKMPPGFTVAGVSPNAPFAMIQDEKRKYYGLMFHPEVVHTPDGAKLIRNFVRKVAGLTGDWTMRAFREEAIDKIRAQVGKGKVICGLSGGVDFRCRRGADPRSDRRPANMRVRRSRHAAARRSQKRRRLFRHHYNIPLVHVDASKQFLGELEGVTDPEKKRKTIGRLFIDVFDAEAKKIGGADFLAQGTLYPDVIESVSFTGGPSVTIKSHHNVGGLPGAHEHEAGRAAARTVQGRSPRVGPRARPARKFVGRHPFPGPGLAIRCPGDITKEKLDILRNADAVYIDQIRKPASTTRSGRPSPCCCR